MLRVLKNLQSFQNPKNQNSKKQSACLFSIESSKVFELFLIKKSNNLPETNVLSSLICQKAKAKKIKRRKSFNKKQVLAGIMYACGMYECENEIRRLQNPLTSSNG